MLLTISVMVTACVSVKTSPQVVDNVNVSTSKGGLAEITEISTTEDLTIAENLITKEDSKITGNLKIHFIDVGQGDSIFVEFPNKKTMLIDAGPATGIVPGYIKNEGYDSIDYVVTTHPDADHISGMPEVLDSFKIKTFYMPEKEHTTKIFEKMLDAIASNGCFAEYAFAGKKIIYENTLKVYFVGPVRIYEDNNSCSAVIKIEYNENSFILTGDADYVSENDIISAGYNLKSDVIKVGHHGSKSSTSEKFLREVNPQDAIISVGKNSYGHPTAEILGMLNNYGINVYRTDEVGSIVVTSDGINYTIDKNKTSIQVNAPPVVQAETRPQTNTAIENNVNQQSLNNELAVVYRTKTGSKHHCGGCSYLKSSIEITAAKAKSMGLTPCSRCNPPR